MLEDHVFQLNGTPSLQRVYTYGHDLISQDQVLTSGSGSWWNLSFYTYDGLGSVRGLTDVTGTVTDAYDYDAYGVLISQSSIYQTPTPNSYLYTGEQWDADLGFYYLRARYSNPETGRFWTMDSYEGQSSDPLTLHKYLYCHANPINLSDPSGHFADAISMMAAVQIGVLVTVAVTSVTAAIIHEYRESKGRPLTTGEISLARSVFGSKIDYTKVKVYNTGYFLGIQFRDVAMTPNGNIYARGNGTPASGIYRTDYSTDSDPYTRALFIHEMVHVWQHQAGQALDVYLEGGRNYAYDLPTLGTRDLKSYSIEEQASIVEDFYLRLQGQTIYQNHTPVQTPPPLWDYLFVILKYFPLT